MTKLQITKVKITRAEGRPSECISRTFEGEGSLKLADAELRAWARTTPEGGGYDKCDFWVTWSDGETYEGRYDLVRDDTVKASLGGQMVSFLRFYAGTRCPEHLTEVEYRAFLKRSDVDAAEYQVWLDTRSFE
jgi:hypothetical protein